MKNKEPLTWHGRRNGGGGEREGERETGLLFERTLGPVQMDYNNRINKPDALVIRAPVLGTINSVLGHLLKVGTDRHNSTKACFNSSNRWQCLRCLGLGRLEKKIGPSEHP